MKHSHRQPQRRQAYFFLLINTITWGAALIVAKPALDITTTFRFLSYRYLLAVILSLPLLWYYLPKIQRLKPALASIGWLEILGTTISLALLYLGLARTSAIEASLLTSSTPIFISLFGVWFLHEREERNEIIGTTIALVGTVLLTLLPLWHGQEQFGRISLSGNLLIVGQNITIALYYVLAKKRYARLPKLFVTTISFYIGLITFAALSWFEAGSLQTLQQLVSSDWRSPTVLLASGYMALFGSIIGLTAYIKGQDGIEASEAAIFSYLQPVIYIPLGILLLKENVSPLQLLSLILILLGVVVAERRRSS